MQGVSKNRVASTGTNIPVLPALSFEFQTVFFTVTRLAFTMPCLLGLARGCVRRSSVKNVTSCLHNVYRGNTFVLALVLWPSRPLDC